MDNNTNSNSGRRKNAVRGGIGAMVLSAAALVGLALHEGYSDKAIIPVKGDVPTIGFGTTGGVKMGDRILTPTGVSSRASGHTEV